jgi:hypothetical protein
MPSVHFEVIHTINPEALYLQEENKAPVDPEVQSKRISFILSNEDESGIKNSSKLEISANNYSMEDQRDENINNDCTVESSKHSIEREGIRKIGLSFENIDQVHKTLSK